MPILAAWKTGFAALSAGPLGTAYVVAVTDDAGTDAAWLAPEPEFPAGRDAGT